MEAQHWSESAKLRKKRYRLIQRDCVFCSAHADNCEFCPTGEKIEKINKKLRILKGAE